MPSSSVSESVGSAPALYSCRLVKASESGSPSAPWFRLPKCCCSQESGRPSLSESVKLDFPQFEPLPTCTGERRFVVVPSPSLPSSLSPQAHKVPSLFRPREWRESEPVATAAKPLPTCTGECRFVMVPSPIWPRPFRPHAHSVPSPFQAQGMGLASRNGRKPAADLYRYEFTRGSTVTQPAIHIQAPRPTALHRFSGQESARVQLKWPQTRCRPVPANIGS